MNKHTFRIIYLALTLAIVAVVTARAGQVNFSGSMKAVYLDSTGAPLTGEFVFELGAFTPGFSPTADNVTQWKANWTAMARTALNERTRLFSAKQEITSNATPFTTGNRGWIWGYRPMNGPNEWILIGAPDWKWPAVSSVVPAFWSTTGASAVVGYLDPSAPRGQLHLQTAVIDADPPVMDVTAWSNLMFGADAGSPGTGPEDDYDGDGTSNIMEFAFGSNPRARGGDIHPEFVYENANGKVFGGLKVGRNPYAAAKFDVEYSLNLVDWQSTGLVKTKDQPAELIVRDNLPVDERQKVFFRVKVKP